MSDLAREIWDYLIANEIMITVKYLPGTLNEEADHQSRSVTDSSEWKLNPLIFKKICKVFWTPDIDLFASIISHQVPANFAWKSGTFSKGTDAFQLSWRNFKGCTFPLLSSRKGFEESSSGKCYNNFVNSGMAGTIMVTKGISDERAIIIQF